MNHKLNSLQAGRGLAAIAVLLCHIPLIFGPFPQEFGGLVSAGSRGVDFFFVLSGFIIFYTNRTIIGVPAAAPFYFYRRVVRIWPLLAVFTVVKLFYMLAGGEVPEHKLSFSYVVTSTLLFPQTQPPFLQVSWTLSFEMFFYSIFLLAILYGKSMRVVCMIHAALCLLLNLSPLAPGDYPVSFLFSPYIPEFYAGSVIAWFYLDVKRAIGRWPATGCLLGGVAILVVGVCGQQVVESVLPNCQQLFWGTGVGLAIFGAIPLERAGLLRVPAWMVFLGDASYSIYLAHTSIQQVLKAVLSRCGFIGAAHPQLCLWLVASLSLGLCLVVYVLIEQPLLRWFHERGPRKYRASGV